MLQSIKRELSRDQTDQKMERGHAFGQLSRIHRVRLFSLTSPAASDMTTDVACACSGENRTPFFHRNETIVMKAMRLLPSTKA
jgi:hypothetical protein